MIKYTTKYHKWNDKYSGLAIDYSKGGTHRDYNVLYNGICSEEYFNTQKEALNKAKEYGVL